MLCGPCVWYLWEGSPRSMTHDPFLSLFSMKSLQPSSHLSGSPRWKHGVFLESRIPDAKNLSTWSLSWVLPIVKPSNTSTRWTVSITQSPELILEQGGLRKYMFFSASHGHRSLESPLTGIYIYLIHLATDLNLTFLGPDVIYHHLLGRPWLPGFLVLHVAFDSVNPYCLKFILIGVGKALLAISCHQWQPFGDKASSGKNGFPIIL